MVRRKRRSTGRRRAAAVPNRRRRTSIAVRSNRRRAALTLNPRRRRSRRHAVANPHRRRRSRRNPSIMGIAKGGLWVGAGGFATNIVAGYIPLGGGGWMDVLKQLAASWVVGFIAERIPFIGPANAQLMTYGGFGSTAWSAANMLLSGASGFLHPAQTAQPAMGYYGDISTYPPGSLNGMGEIVNAPEWYNQASMQNG